jgi:hypothetical protein
MGFPTSANVFIKPKIQNEYTIITHPVLSQRFLLLGILGGLSPDNIKEQWSFRNENHSKHSHRARGHRQFLPAG